MVPICDMTRYASLNLKSPFEIHEYVKSGELAGIPSSSQSIFTL